MSSTAAPNPRPLAPVEAPELSFDEVAAWLDEVLAILEATSAVAPLGSMGLRQWVVDQVPAFDAVVAWIQNEIDDSDGERHRHQDACWLLLRFDVAFSMLRVHIYARPHAA